MTLTTNRYGVVTPTARQLNGLAISTPIYLSLTTDQTKKVLNAFREAKTKQLLENGWDSSDTPPKTKVEEELGMNEENLRHSLFTRQGIPERLLVKLQRLTGVELVTREQIEETYSQWLDHLWS